MRNQMIKTMLAVTLVLSPAAVVSGSVQPVQAAEQNNNPSMHTAWVADLPGQYAQGLTVGENGLAYVVVNKYTPDGSEYPALVCIDSNNNGAVKWQQELTGLSQGTAPAVAKDGTVYVTTQGFDPDGVTLFAFNSNGSLKWKKEGIHGGNSVSVAPNGDVYLVGHDYTNEINAVLVFKSSGELIFDHVEPGDIDRFTYLEKVMFDQQGKPCLLYQLGTNTVSNSVVTLDFANKTLREVFKPEEEEVSLQQLFIAKDGTLNAVGWQYLGYASPTDSFLYSVSTNGSAQKTHIGTPYSVLYKGPDDSLFLTTERMDANGDTLTDGLRAFDASSSLTPKWESNVFQSESVMTSDGDTLQNGTFVIRYRESAAPDAETVESGVIGLDRNGKQLFKVPTMADTSVVAGDLVLSPVANKLIAYSLGAGSLTTADKFIVEDLDIDIPASIEALKQELDKDVALSRAYAVRSAIENAQNLSPEDSVKYSEEIANLFHQHDRLDEAIYTLETAVSRYSGYRSLYATLGSRYEETGNPDMHVLVNGTKPQFDVLPVVQNGRTLVPLRAIGEALGAEIGWDGATSTVTMNRDGHTVKLSLGSNVAYKDGQAVPLDVAAQSIDNRTVVPLRFISEAFGAKVTWFEEGKIAAITDSELK